MPPELLDPMLLFVLPILVFMAFIDGAAVLLAGPLDRLKLSRESFKAPISCQVDPTGAGLLEGKALLLEGRDGGP